MNYEELYSEYQTLEKVMKEKINMVQKLSKAIAKEMESGDLKSFRRDIGLLEAAAAEEARIVNEMKELESGFNSQEYFEGGEFAAQMLEACEELNVDVKGEFPVYEMFPYKVKIDTENQDLYLDRKKVQCMRPQGFAKQVKAGQDKLMKAPFNALLFANELADVYDLALLKLKKQPNADVYLTSLYKFLAPMGRFRRDYDQQSYAFDLARLYASGISKVKDGRSIQFGPSKNNNKAIRILDDKGREEYLATIRFYWQEENQTAE